MEGNAADNAVGVKLTFDGQMRRFPFTGNSLAALHEQLVSVLSLEKTAELVIKYTDEEEDLITITTDLELRSAIVPGQLLRLIVSLKGANPTISVPSAPGDFHSMIPHYGGNNNFRSHIPKAGDFRSMIPKGGAFMGGMGGMGGPPPGMGGGEEGGANPQGGRGRGMDFRAFMMPFMAKMAAGRGGMGGMGGPPGMGGMGGPPGMGGMGGPPGGMGGMGGMGGPPPGMEGAHQGPPPGMGGFGGIPEKFKTCPVKNMKKHHKKMHKKMLKGEYEQLGPHAIAHHAHHHHHPHHDQAEKLVARFAKDVSIEDGTVIPPNTPFVKTWRLRNEGAPWPAGCGLLFVGKKSDNLGAPALVPIPNVVETNQEIDVSVNLVSPDKSGRYTGYWRMSTPDGRKFGQRVWASIVVPSLTNSSSSSEGEQEADKYEALVDVVLRNETFRAFGVKRHWVFRLLQKCNGDVNEVVAILTKKLEKKAKKAAKKAAKF